MKVALVQMNAGENVAANMERAQEWVSLAASKGAQFIALPELFMGRGGEAWREADAVPGSWTAPFCALAAQFGCAILLGSGYEKSKQAQRVYNTSVLIDPAGDVVISYRKIHLFYLALNPSVMIDERKRFLPGLSPAMGQIDAWRIGLSVCYDLRFPELYRCYAQAEANLLVVPSSFTAPTGEAHWEVLLRARAIENLSYVLAPNQVGRDGNGVLSYGHSLVVDPWGHVLACGSPDQEELVWAELSLDAVAQARQVLPALSHICLSD